MVSRCPAKHLSPEIGNGDFNQTEALKWGLSFRRKWDLILLLNLLLISGKKITSFIMVFHTLFIDSPHSFPSSPLPPTSCWSPSSPVPPPFHIQVIYSLLPFFLPLISPLRSLSSPSHVLISSFITCTHSPRPHTHTH